MPDIAGNPAANTKTAPRFLALGDSYTIGESVADQERWPVQLARDLRAMGIPLEEPILIARTGWTTEELDAGIDAANPVGPFSLVTLLIGVNDQYRGREPEAYRAPFAALLRRATRFAGGDVSRVIVVSIPDWGVTPFASGRDANAIASAIDAFNAVNREETAKARASYVDITPASRRARTESGLTAADGLHPSGSMYGIWTALILPMATHVLRGR